MKKRYINHYSLKKSIFQTVVGFLLVFFMLNAYAVDMAEIAALKNQSYARVSQQMPAILQTLHQNPMTPTPQSAPRVMLFVSLGMPDLLLKQLLQAAHRLKVAVVIRGLYHDSFDATLKRLKALMPEDQQEANNQSGVLINPLWFREYHIDAVPAVVVPHGTTYDVIFGNVALEELLEDLKNHHKKAGGVR
jgi:conjugal transfer pilus assembly protein TrbC